MFGTHALSPVSTGVAAAPATRPWTFRLVSDFAELQRLAPAWQELHDHSADKEPMTAPAWLTTWWQVYGQDSGRQLRVGLLYDGDRLVGMAPLCRRRYWYRPGIPFARLEFLGSDVDEADGVCSIYLQFLARAGFEQRVTDAFVREMADGAFGPWDEIVLSALNGADGATDRLLHSFQRAGLPGVQKVATDAPYLKLPTSWDAFLSSLNKKHRKFIKTAWRDFEAWAGTDWIVETAATPSQLARGYALLAQLHNQRWQQADASGAFARPRFNAFHEAYLPVLFQEGKLQLAWLSVRDQPVVVHYQIVANHKVYFYQCGRSLDVPEPIRPGIVMIALSLQEAIQQGLGEYDFLGGAAQYKLAFTDTVRPIAEIRVARNGLVELLRRCARSAARIVRGE